MPSLEADGGMNVRQRRAPAASARRQQTSMLHQINAHERREKQQLKLIQSHQDVLFAGMLQSYCKVLAFLLVLGIVLVLYFQPSQLLSLWRRSSERLPPRRIATLYPAELNVLEALPRFFLGYAIATPGNEKERQAVKEVAAQRKIVTDSGHFRQKITYTAWEHHDFAFQPPGALDHFCGPGFQQVYSSIADDFIMKKKNYSNNDDNFRQDFLDDLLLQCLLKSGSADGYVKRNVTVVSSLTRGIQGVAAKYVHQNRIHSSILLLPLLSKQQLHNKQSGALPRTPSTVLPVETMKYLLSDTISSNVSETYVQKWEEFLYTIIRNESASWELLNAACTDKEREELQTDQRLIATTCRQTDDECCWIYDPTMKPFGHPSFLRRNNDDND